MTKVTDERAAFEAWISDPLQGGAFFAIDAYALRLASDGEYADPETFGAYLAWKAALSRQGKVVSLEKVQSIVDAYELAKTVPTAASTQEWEDGYTEAVDQINNDLRALMGEDHG